MTLEQRVAALEAQTAQLVSLLVATLEAQRSLIQMIVIATAPRDGRADN